MEHRPGSAHDATAGLATTDKASVWEDFLDIFYAPSSVFARREHGREHGAAGVAATGGEGMVRLEATDRSGAGNCARTGAAASRRGSGTSPS